MDVSVVIVNWNSAGRLARLLESLRATGEGEDVREILVVDNASQDGSRNLDPGHALWLKLETNIGFAAGANIGISRTSGSWVLLLNPDIEVSLDHVRRLVDFGEHEDSAALLCGELYGEDGEGQRAFQIRRLPSWRSVVSDALFLDELRAFLRPGRTRFPEEPSVADRPVGIEQPAAAYWLLRRTAWEQIGGFDEDFVPAWFEDVDFCKRLLDAGWRIFLCPDCPARHQGGYSVDVLGRSRFLSIYYGNLLLYLRKHHRASYPWLWLPVKLGLLLRKMGVGRR